MTDGWTTVTNKKRTKKKKGSNTSNTQYPNPYPTSNSYSTSSYSSNQYKPSGPKSKTSGSYYQNLDPVVFRSRGKAKSKRQRSNGPSANTVTIKKFNGGKNKQTQYDYSKKMDSEDYVCKKISSNLSKKMIQARTDQNLTQKELALKCNLSVQVIQNYERGKGVPNYKEIAKIGRALNIPLSNK